MLYLSDELILDHLGNVLFVVMCLALKFFLSGTIATALPGSSVGKESACNAGDIDSMPRSGRSPWRRKWQPTPVFLPGKSHGRHKRVSYNLAIKQQ